MKINEKVKKQCEEPILCGIILARLQTSDRVSMSDARRHAFACAARRCQCTLRTESFSAAVAGTVSSPTTCQSASAEQRRLCFQREHQIVGTLQPRSLQPDIACGEIVLDFSSLGAREQADVSPHTRDSGAQGPRRTRQYDNSRRAKKAAKLPSLRRRIHAANGFAVRCSDRARIDALIEAPHCRCGRRSCFSQFGKWVRELHRFVAAFAALSKVQQERMLAASYIGNRRGASLSMPATLLFMAVSVTCLGAILLVGDRRLIACCRGLHFDRRARGCSKVRVSVKGAHVDQYFFGLWLNLAETLPDQYHQKLQARKRRRRRVVVDESGSSSDESRCDGTRQDAAEPSPDIDLRAHAIGQSALWDAYVYTGFGSDVSQLALRFLPPGTVSDLYVDYAFSSVRLQSDAHIAKYWTFWSRWVRKWSTVLRFRLPTDFADCDTCAELKLSLKDPDNETRVAALKAYQEHTTDVAASRNLEAAMRNTPPFGVAKPVLVVMTDGMDQAHWSLPRMRGHRARKKWGAYFRPRCKVQGVWVFFLGFHLFLADRRANHFIHQLHCIPDPAATTPFCIAT